MGCLLSRASTPGIPDIYYLQRELPQSFADAVSIIASGHVKLLDVKWLTHQPMNWKVVRCQDLPAEAFLSSTRAAELFQTIESIGAVSYRWLTKAHPDPDGFHFKTLLAFLKKGGYPTRGLFWDYSSLPQVDSSGKRSPEDQVSFDIGLKAINFIYGSPLVTIIQLKEMPEDSPVGPYSESGWCTFEEVSGAILKPSDLTVDLSMAKGFFKAKALHSQDECRTPAVEKRSGMTGEPSQLELRQAEAKACAVPCTMTLLQLDPESTLHFCKAPRWERSGTTVTFYNGPAMMSILKLKNLTSTHVAFKLMVTAPGAYILQKASGNLGPEETTEVKIAPSPSHDGEAGRHKFRVQAVAVDSSEPVTLEQWKEFGKDVVQQHTLNVVFETSPQEAEQERLEEDRLREEAAELADAEMSLKKVCAKERMPPVHPDRFADLILTKKFTNGADSAKVAKLYSRFFFSICEDAKALDFRNRAFSDGWTDEEGVVLAQALAEFKHCEILCLDGHSLGDIALSHIADAITKMPKLKVFENRGAGSYGKQGLREFTKLLPKMRHLRKCVLHGDVVEMEEARDEFVAEWKRRGVSESSYYFGYWD